MAILNKAIKISQKHLLGIQDLSIKDINNDLDVKYNLIENKLDFNILDRRMFN